MRLRQIRRRSASVVIIAVRLEYYRGKLLPRLGQQGAHNTQPAVAIRLLIRGHFRWTRVSGAGRPMI